MRLDDPRPRTMIEPSEFRRVIGHFATGVTVVTALRDGRPYGMTANAVCAVSLDPTLLLVCVDRAAETYEVLAEAAGFVVNVLAEPRGESLARRFAQPPAPDRFDGVSYERGRTGAPVLEQALAWLECERREIHPGGDHGIFIGEVVEADADEGTPLLYYRGGYGRLCP